MLVAALPVPVSANEVREGSEEFALPATAAADRSPIQQRPKHRHFCLSEMLGSGGRRAIQLFGYRLDSRLTRDSVVPDVDGSLDGLALADRKLTDGTVGRDPFSAACSTVLSTPDGGPSTAFWMSRSVPTSVNVLEPSS
jgi:hypothetical protein